MLASQTVDLGAFTGTPDQFAPPSFHDPRFRGLLAEDDWLTLSEEVRKRFSRKLGRGQSTIYHGRTLELRMGWAGRLLAGLSRLIGGPLPINCDEGGAATVVVTMEPESGGQVWTRLYVRSRGFPQVIHSAKRFAGPTGLEEHIGYGIGMTLRLSTDADGLIFTSERYFATLLGHRVYLPSWLTPGRLVVRHEPHGRHAFCFGLQITHWALGELVHQVCIFEEAGS
ncbi:MAG: DUF4166 domain-containing protein [Pseudomonadota bacterium]